MFLVKPGTVLFEIAGVELELVEKAFKLAGAKLPVKVSRISRVVGEVEGNA